VVERLGALERVQILIDVEVVVRDVKPPEEPLRTSRVFAPVSAKNSDHLPIMTLPKCRDCQNCQKFLATAPSHRRQQ
jgi:hypothetical protein